MENLTSTWRKTVASLDSARHRRETGLFKAEGTKCVTDMTPWFRTRMLLATHEWLDANPGAAGSATACSARDMERMSSMVTPPGVIAVMETPCHTFDPDECGGRLLLALDAIRDPGNLGTIIRIADWFGIDDILCSPDTTDCYAPKVVQATMGSLARVRLHYLPLAETLAGMRENTTVYGTFLNGEPVYDTCPATDGGIIVIGNESHGISAEVAATVTRRITIPSYPAGGNTGESLNAATAAAITISTFREALWRKRM